MLRSPFPAGAGATGGFGDGSDFAAGSIPGTRVNLGRISLLGALTVIGTGGRGGWSAVTFLLGSCGGAVTVDSGSDAEVGTGGPLEAGTLSAADAPVPFGGRWNGISLAPGVGTPSARGVCGVAGGEGAGVEVSVSKSRSEIFGRRDRVELSSATFCFGFANCRTAGSGSASAIVCAIAGSTFIGGFVDVSNGSISVPKRSVSSIVTCKIGVSSWGKF